MQDPEQPVTSSSPTHLPDVGTVTVTQHNLVTYVAEDFLEKIRRSGRATEDDNQSSLSGSSDIPMVDADILDSLERYTKQLSVSFEKVMTKLTGDLHKASAITVGYAQTYKDATEALGVRTDEAVQSMYSLMAHSEELSRAMEPVRQIHEKIKHIKEFLAALEAQVV